MKYLYTTAVLAFAVCAFAAPLEKRQVYESSALDVSALPSISLALGGSEPTALPSFSLPSFTSLPSLSLPALGQGSDLPDLSSVIEKRGSAHRTGALPVLPKPSGFLPPFPPPPFPLPPFPVPSGGDGHPELPKPTGSIPPFPLPLGSGGLPELPKPLATGVGGDTYRSHRQKRQDISSLLGGSGTSDPLSSLPSGSSSLGGLSGLGSLGSLSSGTPSLSGLGSSSSGLGDLSSLGDGSGDLSSLLGGSSSDSSSGLSSLSSLDGSSSDLSSLRKEKRQDLGSLTSLLSGLSGTSSAAVASATSDTSVASATSAAAASSSSASALGDLGSLSSLTTSSSAAISSNDVTDNTGCKKVTLIFARGTTEPGTLGLIIGPSLASDLQTATGSLAVQGVDYPASIEGNAELGGSGGPEMVKLATQALSQCPDTKLVLGGYSQGAMVVHYALSNGFDGSKVAAVTAFGDPENSASFKGVDDSKVARYCDSGDGICDLGGTTTGTGTHLSYGDNAQAAAQKIATIVGVTA